MSRDEVLALVARLDPGARASFREDGVPFVYVSEALTEDGLAELLREVPEAQIMVGATSKLWDELERLMRVATARRAGYELDDLNEDGSWKSGHPPVGWGELP